MKSSIVLHKLQLFIPHRCCHNFDTCNCVAAQLETDCDSLFLPLFQGANGPQKKSCCADVPTAREEVGDIVTLEPTINKEVCIADI